MLFLFHLFLLIVFQCLRLFKYLILFSPFLSSPFTLLLLLLFSLFFALSIRCFFPACFPPFYFACQTLPSCVRLFSPLFFIFNHNLL